MGCGAPSRSGRVGGTDVQKPSSRSSKPSAQMASTASAANTSAACKASSGLSTPESLFCDTHPRTPALRTTVRLPLHLCPSRRDPTQLVLMSLSAHGLKRLFGLGAIIGQEIAKSLPTTLTPALFCVLATPNIPVSHRVIVASRAERQSYPWLCTQRRSETGRAPLSQVRQRTSRSPSSTPPPPWTLFSSAFTCSRLPCRRTLSCSITQEASGQCMKTPRGLLCGWQGETRWLGPSERNFPHSCASSSPGGSNLISSSASSHRAGHLASTTRRSLSSEYPVLSVARPLMSGPTARCRPRPSGSTMVWSVSKEGRL